MGYLSDKNVMNYDVNIYKDTSDIMIKKFYDHKKERKKIIIKIISNDS